MAAVNIGSTNLTAGTWELDESRAYTLIASTDPAIVTIDGGDPVSLTLDIPIVIGPGVEKVVVGALDTADLIPRNDERM
tara:strand:- start:199 stop:435 length:237 start_codon:yes stop_codon:yes gene_type:complete